MGLGDWVSSLLTPPFIPQLPSLNYRQYMQGSTRPVVWVPTQLWLLHLHPWLGGFCFQHMVSIEEKKITCVAKNKAVS